MPIYDYKCPGCNRKQEDVFVHRHDSKVKCIQCHAIMKKLFSFGDRPPVADVFPADGVFLKHVSAEGKRFFSKRDMRKYEKNHDVELGYLL